MNPIPYPDRVSVCNSNSNSGNAGTRAMRYSYTTIHPSILHNPRSGHFDTVTSTRIVSPTATGLIGNGRHRPSNSRLPSAAAVITTVAVTAVPTMFDRTPATTLRDIRIRPLPSGLLGVGELNPLAVPLDKCRNRGLVTQTSTSKLRGTSDCIVSNPYSHIGCWHCHSRLSRFVCQSRSSLPVLSAMQFVFGHNLSAVCLCRLGVEYLE